MARAVANLAPYVEPQNANSDERVLGNFIGNFSKCLPHADNGEVDDAAYRALLVAIHSGRAADFALVPRGGVAKLANPRAARAFQMEGQDASRVRIPPAPSFASEQRAAEMNEVYWMALLRDVPLADLATAPLAQEAVSDLSRYSLFSNVDTSTLFRGVTAGERIGPYLSQFLWRAVPYGMTTIEQRYAGALAGEDFMTTPADCLAIQRGAAPTRSITRGAPAYVRTARDLASYVQRDFSYQAFLNAALITLGFGAPALDSANPYIGNATEGAFITFGGPDILTMLAQVSHMALKTAWWQKWQVHRTLRPEAFATCVDRTAVGTSSYPVHGKLLTSSVFGRLRTLHGNVVLPMAYPEGSPAHPSYPAGHAVIAGACVTVLKAFFNESFVVPNPVTAVSDGSLQPYSGPALTLGNELNKLAANIAIGRNHAGVHFWSDGIEGMRAGERVALAYLADLRTTYAEDFSGFSLTRFDGSTVVA